MIDICEPFVQDVETGKAKKVVVHDGEREYNIYKVKDIVRIDIKKEGE
mgnify:CR=1 FL=1|jgi:hypothetical protein